uniref:Putative lipocalin n=1 Tax=Ixodes ricinus TaxID=34613 RepID=V5ICE9_IXORI
MGLLYAALFACIATTSAWQAQMTIRNPENNPLLNDPNLGPLQSAWKAINKSKDDPFVLMFRSKNHEPNITCVLVTASLHNKTLKVVNFTRTYYNKTDGKKLHFDVPSESLESNRLQARKCYTCRLERHSK